MKQYTEAETEELMNQGLRELKAATEEEFILPVRLDLPSITCIVAAIQLAQRHPGFTGTVATVCREFIAQTIAKLRNLGYVANSEMLELGNNPDYDRPRTSAEAEAAGRAEYRRVTGGE